MKNVINWKIFFILLTLSLLSVVAVFPYVMTLQGDIFKQLGIPIFAVFVAQLIQSALLLSLAIFVGMLLAKKISFHFPVLEAFVKSGDFKKIIKDISLMSILLGIFAALAIYATDYFFTMLGANVSTHSNIAPIWQKLLASFYGGITEEILLRLFIMSLLIWISTKIIRRKAPSSAIIVFSIIVASIIFGLGHLPVTAALTKLTNLVILRAVVLNSIGGIVFGWLYWKKGLEAAMISHFTADVFLLTILPLVLS